MISLSRTLHIVRGASAFYVLPATGSTRLFPDAIRRYVTPPKEPIVLPAPRMGLLALRDLGFLPLGMLIDVTSRFALQPPVSTAVSCVVAGGIFSAYKLRERARQRIERAIESLATARLVYELENNPALRETMKLEPSPAPSLFPNADALFPLVSQTPFAKTELVNGVFQIKGKPFTMEDGLFLVVASSQGKVLKEPGDGKGNALQLAEFAVLRVRDDRWVHQWRIKGSNFSR
jgi:hypothetical protein